MARRDDPKRCSGSATHQHVTIEYAVEVSDCPLCLALGCLSESTSVLESMTGRLRLHDDVLLAIGKAKTTMMRLHYAPA